MKTIDDIEQQILYKVGILFSEKRRERGLSVRGLSRSSGVSSTVISDLENAKKLPTIKIIIKLCLALKMDLDEVLNSLTVAINPDKPSLAIVLADYGYTKKQVAKIIDYIEYVKGKGE